MATLVREVMETNPVTVTADAGIEDVVGALRENELPGVPVVDGDGRCVGIVTEADLVLPDDQGDLHLPHYINLFGGTVFLEPLSRYEVEFADGTGKPRALSQPVLFESTTALPQPKLFGLDSLGEGGWLKALRLEVYAPRRPRAGSLQQALFPYHEAWG